MWFQRKEKLGERISALQQLVSPFGKVSDITIVYLVINLICVIGIKSHEIDEIKVWIEFENGADRHSFGASRGDGVHKVSA